MITGIGLNDAVVDGVCAVTLLPLYLILPNMYLLGTLRLRKMFDSAIDFNV